MQIISRWKDLEKAYRDMPEIFLFDSSIDIPPELKRDENLKYENLKRFPGVEWLVHVPFPFPVSDMRDKFITELEPLFGIIKGGSTAVFRVSPSDEVGLLFLLDFMGSLYWFCHGDKPRIEPYYTCQDASDDDTYLDIPLPVGKLCSGSAGCETIIWTRRWKPGLERIDELFSEVFIRNSRDFTKLFLDMAKEKHLDYGKELWDRLSTGMRNIKTGKVLVRNGESNSALAHQGIRDALSRSGLHLADRLRMPSGGMRDYNHAWPESGDSSCQILEREKRWPAALAIPFNKGRVIVCPSSWDDEKIARMLDNSTCSNADSELKGTSQTEETYTLEVVVPPEATNSDARSFIRSLKVKFYVGDKNGEKEDDGEPVEFDYLLKFLVIWFQV